MESGFGAGTTVYFLGGDVWNEELTLNNVHGSPGNPVVFMSYGSGKPVIDGNGGSIGTCISADQASGTGNVSYLTISGFECRNTSQYGFNFRVENSAMHGIVIQNNYIHNTGPGAYLPASKPYDDGSYRNQLNAEDDTSGVSGGDGFQIISNIVNNCGGHNCLQVHYDVGGPLVQGNRVGPGCVHNCIDTKGAVGGRIINNVVTCPTCPPNTAGFYTENTYYGTSDTTYIGNTARDVPIGFQAEWGGLCALKVGSGNCQQNLKYYNNTVYNASQFSIISTSCPISRDIQKNIFDGGPVDIHLNCSVTWNDNDGFSISGAPSGSGNISVDPQFVNPSGGDFTPQNSSVNSGWSSNTVTPFDYLGAVK
jgi:hypothetical protein